jgi:hypothetical protein
LYTSVYIPARVCYISYIILVIFILILNSILLFSRAVYAHLDLSPLSLR